MSKYNVTTELSNIIRAVRIKNNIKSKALAEYIGKSQSYISKLEKGDIKTIQEAELTSIIRFIFKDTESQNITDSIVEQLNNNLKLAITDYEDIANQIWFQNYDTVMRQIPIPTALVDNINARMRSLNLSINDICTRINANEALYPEISNNDQYAFNEWHVFLVDQEDRFFFIKMKVDCLRVEKILNREIVSSNYVTILSIVYHLLKFEQQDSQVDDDKLVQDACEYLNSYKFYSIYQRDKLNFQAQTVKEKDELLSSFDKNNALLLKDILEAFKVFSDLDIMKTNEYLNSFVKNLEWDNGFMMRLLSIPFFRMSNMSFTIKRQMLLEIQELAKNYQELPDNKKGIENYD